MRRSANLLGRSMREKKPQGGLRAGPKRGRPSLPSPEEGRRLVAAFMSIRDAAAREKIISLVERKSRIDKYSKSLVTVRMRFWIEAGLVALSGLLTILTLFSRDWIEALTGFDPDNQDGLLSGRSSPHCFSSTPCCPSPPSPIGAAFIRARFSRADDEALMRGRHTLGDADGGRSDRGASKARVARCAAKYTTP